MKNEDEIPVPLTTTAPLRPERHADTKPEFFRLPRSGGDPHFGLSRSWFYAAEKEGLLKLIRLRQRGKMRGVVLVPYADVARLVNRARE